MKGVILIALLLMVTLIGLMSSSSGSGVLAAFQHQQRQEIDKQQQLSIDRPVNDNNENQKTISQNQKTQQQQQQQQQLLLTTPTENGTHVIIQGTLKVSGVGNQLTSSLSSSSTSFKQQAPSSISSPTISNGHHRQQNQNIQPTTHTTSAAQHLEAHSTPAATAPATSSASTSSSASSPSSTPSSTPSTTTTTLPSLIPSSTTLLSTTATALNSAASTISSVRAAAPPELGLSNNIKSHQHKRVSTLNKQQQHQHQHQQRVKAPQATQKVQQPQQLPQRNSNDINEPLKASASKTRSSDNNNKQQEQQQHQELIDRMSTSQSVSFTEPAWTRQQQQQQFKRNGEEEKQQQTLNQPTAKGSAGSAGNNRWTHFGARLKPLAGSGSGTAAATTSGDHFETATSNSKAQTYQRQKQQLNHNQPQNHYQQQQPQQYLQQQQQTSPAARPAIASTGAPVSVAPVSAPKPVATNQVDGGDQVDDEVDEDQDSEALLYKMLQQQNFLLSPNWQQEATSGPQTPTTGVSATNGQQRQQQLSRGQNNQLTDSSKRVIKLLKSYSHIHQVDDSDDQIRGTTTRLNSRRPTSSWQQQQQSKQSYPVSKVYSNQQQENGASNRPQLNASNKHNRFSSQESASYPERSQHNLANEQDNPEANGDSTNQIDGQPEGSSSSSSSAGGDDSSANQAPSGGAESAPEDEFECPNNGIFADEASNCQAYHVCQSGAQVQERFQCPMGTLFNNIILTCDFAHNVQCGKSKPKSLTSSSSAQANEADHSDTIYRTQAPKNTNQQVARQQQQVNENSWNKPQSQLPTRKQEPRQSYSSNGGSQKYNQQPTNVRPHQAQYIKPSVASMESSSNNDESDDEPPTPLIPATLPPTRQVPQAASLPYNAPPPRATNAQSHHNQQSHTAHRSQYPNQQQQQRPRMLSADEITPIFVNQDNDELRSTENPHSLLTNDANLISTDQGPTNTNYNLVINHMTSANRLSSVSGQQPKLVGSGKPVVGVDKFVSVNKQQNSPKLHIQEQQHHHSATSNNRMKPSISGRPKELGSVGNQFQQQQRPRGQNLEPKALNTNQRYGSAANYADRQHHHHQTQQTQFKSAYGNELKQSNNLQQQRNSGLNKQHQLAASQQRGTLIDLTNDKSRTSISSEALNDGLLLLLRHGATDQEQAPIAKRSAASKQQQQQGQHSSQAIAVDPSLISSSSPVDAQLFPNVQMLLNNQLSHLPILNNMVGLQLSSEASQSQTVRQAPPPTFAPNSPNQQQTKATNSSSTQETADSPTTVSSKTLVLAPQQQVRSQQQQQNKSVQQQTTAATVTAAATSTEVFTKQTDKLESTSTTQQPNKQKPINKRVKRLKATQLPVNKPTQERSAENGKSVNIDKQQQKQQEADKRQLQNRKLKWPINGAGGQETFNSNKNKTTAKQDKSQAQ